jgi:Domain of unknown function (DUF1942)
MQRSSADERLGVVRRAPRLVRALVLLAAIAVGAAACGTATRSAGPDGQHVNVQETRLGTTLRTDPGNTVTVTAYRSTIDRTGQEALPHRVHFEAAQVRICARASGGVVGPSMVTLRTINNEHVLATESRPIAPALKSQQLARGHCAHGWVTFEVSGATTGARVVVSDLNDDSMRWLVG